MISDSILSFLDEINSGISSVDLCKSWFVKTFPNSLLESILLKTSSLFFYKYPEYGVGGSSYCYGC